MGTQALRSHRAEKLRLSKLLFYPAIFGPLGIFITLGIVGVVSGPGDLDLAAEPCTAIAFCGGAICLIVHYLTSMLGFIFFGSPRKENERNVADLKVIGWDRTKRVVFCFVSQGTHQAVLRESVSRVLSLCKLHDVQFSIEVVVDRNVSLEPFFVASGCEALFVPEDYQTLHRSRFKARALSYAASSRSSSTVDKVNSWIVHCDEDTIITEAALAGIAKHLRREDSHKVCGGGEIKYNLQSRAVEQIFVCSDWHRTGEDLGRFRLQFQAFQATLFGAHGSFLIVPALVEERIGFDFGARGSIAEDIYFGFHLRADSIPFVWVEGYVREQSPRDLGNFLGQRARWINGLLNICFDPAMPFRSRYVLLAHLFVLRVSMSVGLVPFFILLTRNEAPWLVSLWAMHLLVFGTNMLVGTLRNLEEDPAADTVRNGLRCIFVLAVMPIVSLLETAAVINGLLRRKDGFYVVQKMATAEA
jgi:cellulose synthase/poly-beta-1,6-N-acetylglucosamine synthase-like glycosyltransferase